MIDFNISWGPIRSVIQKHFTFNDIKDMIGLAGLDLTKLSHLQQREGMVQLMEN